MSAYNVLRGDDPWKQLVAKTGENYRSMRLGFQKKPFFYSYGRRFRFAVLPQVPETRLIYLRPQNYERVETDVMSRWLQPGDFAIDCGANVGLISALIARRTGRAGMIWALEPAESTFQKLTLVLDALKLDQVRMINAAVSDRVGKVIFADDEFASEANAIQTSEKMQPQCITVEATTLEQLLKSCASWPALIKLDIEGAEPMAFRGWPSLATIPDPPLLVFEVYPRGLQRLGLTPDDLFSALPMSRFRFWHLNVSWPNLWPEFPRDVPFHLADPFSHKWPTHSNVIALPIEGGFAARARRLRHLLPES